jgi:hypothetical protein
MKILDELITELTDIQDRERNVKSAVNEIRQAFRLLEIEPKSGNLDVAIKSALNQALLDLERE